MDGQNDILIIGGGMAGLSAATALAGAGAGVTVLDKGRGPGGRMAARRAEIGGEPASFDHGAQYFTARDPAFRDAVADWETAGVAARWPAAGADAWVGTPGMNAPIRAMAEGLDVRWNVRAERLGRDGALWRVEAGEVVFRAATVLVAVPAEQAAVLLAEPAPGFAARAAAVTSAPCWAVMAGFAQGLPLADTFRADNGPVSWAARNSAKPGRCGGETWVIHASPARSRELIDLPKDEAARLLLADFFAVTGTALAVPQHLDAHRWLYAQPEARKGEGPLFDAGLQIGIAGDWLRSPRVEGAWLSGRALADQVLQERRASTS
ncbi:NAD(P)/FAD-dependent oxidoreductase [Porphyrobacter sp. AAP82]|uniref:NAD(P)/FAD-dependent oxidoreductase n=1 Tax=Porphyrobacter sp. AAP82 TaxID=1248917 RepID=UPI0002D966AF|nr:FAD-dependent oxidoreductase [Porphyrobacter sp. AAP82]